jgi:aminoglycoside phosphotransferase (APT) family kinase protein
VPLHAGLKRQVALVTGAASGTRVRIAMSAVDRQALFSGTELPPEHLRLDVRALAQYFAGRLEGLGTQFTVEKFKGGQSNPTYKLSGAQSYVLRRRPPGPLLPSAHAIDREYRVMTALAGVGFPVPRPYLYCEDESVIGSAFYVVSLNLGRVFWNAELTEMDRVERTAVYDAMNARLADLHALDVGRLGLADFGPPGGYVARNLARWSKVYRQSELVPIPDMDWLIDRLPTMLPKEGRSCLVHGDYGLYNIVVAADGPQIEAVLDWEMATLGDPFVDLADHIRSWWEPPNTDGAATSLREHDLAELGIPSMDGYIEAYCRRIGLAELPYRPFYLGFAQFRYAAMIQGILKRAALGTATSRVSLDGRKL